ncbi:YihY/virulence factor BrkB family protein [Hoyosella altamirensis]|uniref:Membrane protein n=1 Tax=Hoyosella altamirensis TaxID=616997 RepID=A0A839RQQ2_9ACTN|nr:YihY/virulence factor BrkB family protein [Hoyosella altamirensis]MBB3038444.1 membrane protein [Hoyosella altamirensis]
MSEQETPTRGDRPARAHRWHPIRRTGQVIGRTTVKAWDDSIFSHSATAAFWQVLSLPPLFLGVLGMLGYVGDWFGPNTIDIIEGKIITFSGAVFNESVVDQIIQPTVNDVLVRGRLEFVSVGFVLSLWAGSSAISAFVDAIVEAHGQNEHRHPVWQRLFALLLYVVFLFLAVFTMPLVALGPALIMDLIPDSWDQLGSEMVRTFYYPAVAVLLLFGLTTLYKVALPRSLPWHRLLAGAILAGAVFYAASTGLRVYLGAVTRTGYTYGALATPIAFLLFAFSLGFAIMLGAEFNATIQEIWPARATRIEQVRRWLANQAQAASERPDEQRPVTSQLLRLASGSIRVVTDQPASELRSHHGRHEADPADDDEVVEQLKKP